MRTTLIALCLLIASGIWTQSYAQVKFTNTIENCSTIVNDGFIATQVYPGAIEYEFELKNITSGNALTLVSSVNSISLNSFSSIITYSSNYMVKVRVKYSFTTKYAYTSWTDQCEFNLGIPPKEISIRNENCGSMITDLGLPIYSSPVYNATCYTFYITNVTTGQNYESPCTANNFISLSSVSIPLLPGDEIEITVSYTLNGEKSEPSEPCSLRLNHPRKFCELVEPDLDFGTANKKKPDNSVKSTHIVGNQFVLYYEDNSSTTYYAPALWDGNSAQVINTAIEVLEDMDAFLQKNAIANCGDPNQRLAISLSPYTQFDVDNGTAVNALGFATQTAYYSDQNYIDQGCPNITPVVHMAINNAPVGANSTIHIGSIYLNPNVSNFNLNYPTAPTGSEYDLYSVLLHEFTHILGINYGDYKFMDLLRAGGTPLNASGVFSCAFNPNYGTMSTSGCSNVSCVGNYVNDPIYAPNPFENGSSLSHFPDVCGTPLGNNVMNPGISMGQQKRFYHQREVNALQDLGYNFINPFNGVNYTLNNSPYVVGIHDGMLIQPLMEDVTSCDVADYEQIVHRICETWPITLDPLANDINATSISEAVVKTGNANGTVTITGANNDQLSFTATVPGIYVIGYVPANGNRKGLPTYMQINVPACTDADLDAVTCNDGANCNQICIEDVYEHTLIYGDFLVQPTFSGNSFEINCRKHLSSLTDPCYSSVFFWVDTDQSNEYTLSFTRTYTETGTMPNPNVKLRAYLAKSSDMLSGVYGSQTSNFFPSLPANKQLVYEEVFTADSYPATPISFCFTANDEYDMIFFYDEQMNNYNSFRYGKVKIQNLEFMEKEVPAPLPARLAACIPQPLSVGQAFCAASTNSFSWTNQSNTVLSTSQVYSPGNITTPIDDIYTFTMTYPNLPATVITPTQNASCSFSQSVEIKYLECCPGMSQPALHPMTCNSNGRTFGADVDGDNSGAVYYCGAMDPDITFGNQTVSCVSTNGLEGFVVKLDDNCVSWLVRTPFLYSKLEVSDGGRIFYVGGVDPNRYKYLAQYNTSNGSVVWFWNAVNAQITDFALDEGVAQIIVTGRMTGNGFTYDGNSIPGTVDDIFVLRITFNGTYVGHSVIAVNSSASESRVAVRNNNLFLGYATSTTAWRLNKLNYTTLAVLASPAPVPVTSPGGNFVFNALEVEGTSSNVMAQFIYDNPVFYNGSNLLNASGVKRTGYIRINPATLASISSVYLADVIFVQSYMNGSDMDASNGKAVFTYKNLLNEMHVKAINTANDAVLWDKISVGVTQPTDWLTTQGVKFTPSGVYNTGCFWKNILIDNTFPLSTINLNATSYYGIKYEQNSGTITALAVNDETPEHTSVNAELETLGETGLVDENWASLYPNPGKGLFTVKAEGNYRITIRDIHGKVVDHFEGTDQSKCDISERSNGLYLVEIMSDRGSKIFKLIKE